MQSIVRSPRRIVPALVLLLASGGALGGMASAGQPSDGPASCEIRVSREGGMIALTARARADERVDGTYSLRVSGGGTNIRQGGPFRAAPGRPVTLGTVALSANGSGYRAELDVVADGETSSCSKRIDGGI